MLRAFHHIPIAFIFVVSWVACEPCTNRTAVDITDGSAFRDGSVTKYGFTFPPKFTFKRKDNEGTVKTFGCLCGVAAACLPKCCPLGSVVNATNSQCIRAPEYDDITNKGLQVWRENWKLVKTVDLKAGTGEIGLLIGRADCHGAATYPENENGVYFQEDGRLFVEMDSESVQPYALRAADKYCMDTFVENGKGRLDALVCFGADPDEHDYVLSSACMLISTVFLAATLLVYGCLPELRNMHGRVLMGYLACLLVGFVFMAAVQIMLLCQVNYRRPCVLMTFFIYFFLLSSFFWLNVMCFDIWWTFSGKRGLSLEKLSTRCRFLAYCAYAFGGPTALTAFLAFMEFCVTRNWYTPQITLHGTCFLDNTPRLIYFYVPILVLCVSNTVFFVLTAYRIAAVNKQTAVLKSKESARHDSRSSDKQRLILYIKIFAVMGVSWILEVFSAFWPSLQVLWKITDTYNVLMGVIIFVIFVCKRKIFRLIKKRYNHLRGRPMSRTQTTSSRTTSSTRDDITMNSIKHSG